MYNADEMKHPEVRELLAALESDHGRIRLGAAKALRELSEAEPDRLYPQFDLLVRLSSHPNKVLQWNALRCIANLAVVDHEGRVDRLLDQYLAPIDGPAMITAATAIAGGAVIAAAKPYLAPAIAKRILAVERAVYATPECRNVAIGHALKALDRLALLLEDAPEVRAFAGRQIANPRPATAKRAAALAAKLGLTAGPSPGSNGRRHHAPKQTPVRAGG